VGGMRNEKSIPGLNYAAYMLRPCCSLLFPKVKVMNRVEWEGEMRRERRIKFKHKRIEKMFFGEDGRGEGWKVFSLSPSLRSVERVCVEAQSGFLSFVIIDSTSSSEGDLNFIRSSTIKSIFLWSEELDSGLRVM
jgi:hypothetical protein